MNPSPFELAQATGKNISGAFERQRDLSSIDQILMQASESNDPAAANQIMGQLLSRVSPERQPMAAQIIQNKMSQLNSARTSEALRKHGIDPNLPEFAQKQQLEERAANERAATILGRRPQVQEISEQVDITDTIQTEGLQGTPQTQLSQAPTQPEVRSIEGGIKGATDDQLVALSGIKGFSEPAKQELKRRQEDRTLEEKKGSKVFESELKRSEKIISEADQIGASIPGKQSALDLMKDSIAKQDLSFLSFDNLADITGIEALRSPEGALFKTAGKEFFLGNIARAGSRPNEWIERQILEMMPKIGRDPAANLSVTRAFQNEIDLDNERVRLTEKISDRLEAQGDQSKGKLGRLVNKEMSEFAEKKQSELFNDLRAIKAIGDKKPQKFRKVEPGTALSDVVAQSLLENFGNDPDKVEKEAKKLGYTF